MEQSTADERSTAPQSPYTTRDLVIGTIVFLFGLFIVGGIPLIGALTI